MVETSVSAMPEQPEDPYLIDEPRTEPRTLERRPSGTTSPREAPDERPPLRRMVFWSVLALVLTVGIVLYFLFADAVVPVLRTDP